MEAALESLPGIARAAVLGVPDPLWGEVGEAWIETVGPEVLNDDELRDSLSLRIAHYKIPKAFHLVDRLPVLPVGKVDKRALRERCGQR